MAFNIYITRHYDHMSKIAADILLPSMILRTIQGHSSFNLGLATGSSPVGLYETICNRQHEFDPTQVRTWNLDEYAGLPGETREEREQHQQSYTHFMQEKFFKHLAPNFGESNMPPGVLIEKSELEQALLDSEQDVELVGTESGKAVYISPDTENPYLKMILLNMTRYVDGIFERGGINEWILGSGGEGHVAFHESGIPFDKELPIMLVKLADSTIDNAVVDGYFADRSEAPSYAITMTATGVLGFSNTALLLASGERKTEPIAKSVLDRITDSVPISILQRNASDITKDTIYIIDEVAASEIFGKEGVLGGKNIKVHDVRDAEVVPREMLPFQKQTVFH